MKQFPGKGPYLTQLGIPDDKVEPCPFCGLKFYLTVEMGGYIHCVKCGADGPETGYAYKASAMETAINKAIPAWNLRPLLAQR